MGGGLGLDGGLAEYMIVPRSTLLVPTELPAETAAPLSDAGLTAWSAMRRWIPKLQEAHSVAVVFGVGGIGHIALRLLRIRTSAALVAMDAREQTRSLAMSSGASFFLHNSDHDELRQVVREMSHGRGADLVLDTVGVDSTLSAAVSLVAIEGHVAVIGSGGGTYEFTRGAMPYGSTIAEHSAGGVGDLTELVSIAADAALRVEGEVCALDGVEELLDRISKGLTYGRAVVRP